LKGGGRGGFRHLRIIRESIIGIIWANYRMVNADQR
jgi:hypothetical protein